MDTTKDPPLPTKEHLEKLEEIKSQTHDENDLYPLVNEQNTKDTLTLLLVFRFINALCVRTFFQPDEYFQSLEPAWQMAFGSQSGAWITWEWQHRLRSSLHPALFAAIYYVADKPMEYLGFFPQFRAMILSIIPNVVQGLFAAGTDFYTWKLAEKMYGIGGSGTTATLLMTMFSPWHWFCSTRTFSNCLETFLTIAALYYWPWAMTVNSISSSTVKSTDGGVVGSAPAKTSATPSLFQSYKSIMDLRISLCLAATACILRPTNLLIWFCILMPTLTRLFSPTTHLSKSDYFIVLRESLLCGAALLLISALSDRIYFNTWTFPPYQWFSFNVTKDLAVFYGRNDWHYFLSQGLPLLLTTYLPFSLVALYKATSGSGLQFLFTTTILTTLATLSLISHKEVRFIYPLLPLLHILTGPSISHFFTNTTTTTVHTSTFPSSPSSKIETVLRRKALLFLILLLNLSIAGFTTLSHQRGPSAVTKYIRTQYEALALDARGVPLSSPLANQFSLNAPKITDYDPSETFAAFLMPCHSTPWRSQLFYSGLKAWALTCEPPLEVPVGEREGYRDEADRFYDDPAKFLNEEIGNSPERAWPRYIVGFEGIEGAVRDHYEETVKGFKMREVWRTGNSLWHDDPRRTGDIVVWEFVDGSKLVKG